MTFAGIERAAEKFGGRVIGFKNDALLIEWPELGVHAYPAVAGKIGTDIELQLAYDLKK